MKHTIVAKVDNKPGVVSRISGLFTRRGYNIDSLVTGVTENPDIYHLTITMDGTDAEISLLINQLGRIMEVIEVYCTDNLPHVTREFMLLKVKCGVSERTVLLQLADILKCKIVGLGDESLIIEATGDGTKLDSVVRSFESYGILDVVRSGAISVLV
ncbi:MAG: acetolactate synthase small subunit [Oscillospiraceae bacterium]|nr:acetolactate synthase small subunit [Oscillospiraceae bacterium]